MIEPVSALVISSRALACMTRQSPDALLLVAGSVHHPGAGVDGAGVNPEIDQPADEGIGNHFEGQSRKRRFIGNGAGDLALGLGVDADYRRRVQRRGQVVDHGVEQHFDALLAEGAAAQHRDAFVARVTRRSPARMSASDMSLPSM